MYMVCLSFNYLILSVGSPKNSNSCSPKKTKAQNVHCRIETSDASIWALSEGGYSPPVTLMSGLANSTACFSCMKVFL